MYELKTKVNDNSIIEFIEKVENPKKREDAYRLLEIFSEATGLEAKMWGDSMIGFGSYHYKYASGHEGDTFLVGFSPRKAKISLYLNLWDPQCEILLEELGKHTKGKSCIYVNKLSDIDIGALKKLITLSVKLAREKYPE
ncbi:MAG: DUF1801 domain-containing protein [Desulfitobacteriaceae bacterium]|nr:DUF1801 domain-containing protein [Desulfitobacteriaceae bacterium]